MRRLKAALVLPRGTFMLATLLPGAMRLSFHDT
jgi:hypothetical protein